jgi:hypothetical protein
MAWLTGAFDKKKAHLKGGLGQSYIGHKAGFRPHEKSSPYAAQT